MSERDSDAGPPNGARTRMIHLDGGQRRDREGNCSTVIGILPGLGPAVVPYEACFLAHYRAIRALGRGAADPGIAIVVVHVPSCQLVARAWLAARPGRAASAIIGRHSEADVMLDDPLLSLRHLALVLPPPTSWDAHSVSYEVLDLRTPLAFRDERGRGLEALRAEGPCFIALGANALFFLQTGDASDFPELAPDAWSMLPERVFVAEHAAEPDRWRRGAYGARRVPREGRHQTAMSAMSPPLSPGEPLVAGGERPCGHLVVATDRGARRIAVGALAASRGVLLGRYDRCDAADLLNDDAISRSHLLVKRVEGEVIGIDTASTHGTYVQGDEHRVRVVALGQGEIASLAGGRATVAWEPA